MSVTVKWKGKIGYGDIISPICYAHNQAEIYDVDVNLDFYFSHKPGTKFKNSDPETINDRVDYIVANTEGRASVRQFYNKYLDFNHTNYDDSNLSLHNLRFSKNPWTGQHKHITIVASGSNKKKFSEYAPGKLWKDPLEWLWPLYIEELRQHYSIEVIDYTTPVSVAADTIRTSQLVVGYHGSAMWLARWMKAPMMVLSGKREFTEKIFPWCIHSFNESYFSVDFIKHRSLKKMKQVEKDLHDYLHRV